MLAGMTTTPALAPVGPCGQTGGAAGCRLATMRAVPRRRATDPAAAAPRATPGRARRGGRCSWMAPSWLSGLNALVSKARRVCIWTNLRRSTGGQGSRGAAAADAGDVIGGHADAAAASVREGVWRTRHGPGAGVAADAARFFATTNCI